MSETTTSIPYPPLQLYAGAGYDMSDRPTQLSEALLPPAGLVEKRTASAIEALDVEPSREVAEAVGSYYKDHYEQAALIHSVFEDQIDDKAADTLVLADIGADSTVRIGAEKAMLGKLTHNLLKARESGDQQAIARAELKRLALAGQLIGGLFDEQAIGATTCGQEEDGIVQSLSRQYFDTMVAKGYGAVSESSDELPLFHLSQAAYSVLGEHTDRIFEQSIRYPRDHVEAKKIANLKDTVPAGRLYYHSTDRLSEIRQRGNVSTRAQQLADHGMYEANTGKSMRGETVQTDHSRVVHFTTKYRDGKYRGTDGPERAKKGFVSEGTLAFTASELLKTAPYSVNGARLGLVRMRPGVEPLGVSGGSEDEIFYAGRSRTGARPAERYSLPIYADGGNHREITVIKSNQNLEYERMLNGSEGADPIGQNMPGIVYTNMDVNQTPPEVSQLEGYYDAMHAGEYVVPLRGGDIDFVPEFPGRQTDVFTHLRKFESQYIP